MFENYPPQYAVEDSKCLVEITIKENGIKFGEKVSLFVSEVAQAGCKLNGLIAVSYQNSILVYNFEGQVKFN